MLHLYLAQGLVACGRCHDAVLLVAGVVALEFPPQAAVFPVLPTELLPFACAQQLSWECPGPGALDSCLHYGQPRGGGGPKTQD